MIKYYVIQIRSKIQKLPTFYHCSVDLDKGRRLSNSLLYARRYNDKADALHDMWLYTREEHINLDVQVISIEDQNCEQWTLTDDGTIVKVMA